MLVLAVRAAFTEFCGAQNAMISAPAVRADLDRLQGAANHAVSDASPFRTAVRNIVTACRNSPLALASYCRAGLLVHLPTALIQVRHDRMCTRPGASILNASQVSSNASLATCVLEVALCISQRLLADEVTSGGGTYAVGESVMARRMQGDFGEGTVLDALEGGSYVVAWSDGDEAAAKLDAAELMPFGSGMGMGAERRARVAPAFILNNFLMKTAIPSNDLSRVQMVVRAYRPCLGEL